MEQSNEKNNDISKQMEKMRKEFEEGRKKTAEVVADFYKTIAKRQKYMSGMEKSSEDEVAKALYCLGFEVCELEKLLLLIMGKM